MIQNLFKQHLKNIFEIYCRHHSISITVKGKKAIHVINKGISGVTKFVGSFMMYLDILV